MPPRRQTQPDASDHQPAANGIPSEEESLAQLQRAVEQPDDATNAANSSHSNAAGKASSNPATDGARRPAAVGSDYTSLRLLTRRQPADPEAVLHGVDTSNLDLSWSGKDGTQTLDPNGQPWRYPKKRARGEGSNLEQFKDEITERTKNGQGCKAISEALIAMGVDTSVRAVARQRMKWGLRQRAQRKMTEQGLANIRKAHLEHAKRLSNSEPVPVKRVRIRVMRKAEITRMTKEGMSAAQIAENLTSRGVQLSRGAATVERLRTVWGLTEITQRTKENIRAKARNQATRLQKEQFENIAKELGIEDVDAWVKSKMDEECAQDARREYAIKLMGDARPNPQRAEISRRNREQLQGIREEARAERREDGYLLRGHAPISMPNVNDVHESYSADFSPAQQRQDGATGPAEGSTSAAAGPSAPRGVIELTDDEDDSEDEDMGDMDDNGPNTANAAENGGRGESPIARDSGDSDVGGEDQQGVTQVPREAPEGSSTAMDASIPTPVQADTLALSQASQAGGTSGVYALAPGQPAPASHPEPTPGPPQVSHVAPSQVINVAPPQVANVAGDPNVDNVFQFNKFAKTSPRFGTHTSSYGPHNVMTAPPPVSVPFRRPGTQFANIAPRPVSIDPCYATSQASASPNLLWVPSVSEVREMAEFGLTPYSCPDKPPQRYLTPKGMITCHGYEYLASPVPAGYRSKTVHPHSLPPPYYNNVGGESPPVHTWSVVPAHPPPPPKLSRVPQPPLVIPAEEMQKYTVEARVLERYQQVSQECLDMLKARGSGRPAPCSLTGLPPSLKDVQFAKEKLREAAHAILLELVENPGQKVPTQPS